MTRTLTLLLLPLLSACFGRTQVVDIERTRVVLPDGWVELTAPVPDPCSLPPLSNGSLFICHAQRGEALQRCNAQLSNLRGQYESTQESGTSRPQ